MIPGGKENRDDYYGFRLGPMPPDCKLLLCHTVVVAKPLFHTDNSNIVDQLKESRVEREQNFSNFSKRQSEATAAVASENPSRG